MQESKKLAIDYRAGRYLRSLARVARGGVLTISRATHALEVPPASASGVLARLARQGWLKRLRRGMYLILPLESEAAVSGVVEDTWIFAHELFAPCYIGGWSAAEHWDLTEQIFHSTFVVSATGVRRTHQVIAGVDFHVVQVPRKRLEAVGTVWRGRDRLATSSRERTIADALVSPDWLGGIRHLAAVLVAYRESEHWRPARLLEELGGIGTGAAFKRLGFLAEALDLGDSGLVEAARARRTSGIVKLDPSIRSRGRLSKRWGLWANAIIVGPETSK